MKTMIKTALAVVVGIYAYNFVSNKITSSK
ncbi:unknown [Proteobacteria bacterium CAG:495]|nr:unknown [Proteobacteria bacterium CAG:495]